MVCAWCNGPEKSFKTKLALIRRNKSSRTEEKQIKIMWVFIFLKYWNVDSCHLFISSSINLISQKSVLEDPGSVYFYSETFKSIFKEGISSKCNSLLQKALFSMKIGSNRDKLQILIWLNPNKFFGGFIKEMSRSQKGLPNLVKYLWALSLCYVVCRQWSTEVGKILNN